MLPEIHERKKQLRTRLCQSLTWCALMLLVVVDLLAAADLSPTLLLPPLVVISLQFGSDRFRFSVILAAAFGVVLPGLTSLGVPADGSLVDLWGDRLIVLVTLLLIYWHGRHSLAVKARSEKLLASDREQKTRLDTLSRHLPLQMWSADGQGNLIHASEHLVEFTGATEAEILADWPSFLHPDDRARVLDLWAHAVASAEHFIAEFRLRRYDGRYVWHKTQASPVFTAGDSAPSSWLGSAYNIDDLITHQQRADRLADRLRQTIDSITDAFLTLDAEFRITYINQKASDIFGPHLEDLLGKSIWEIGVEHPGNDLAAKLRECMANRSESHFEVRYPPGGQWFEVRIYPSGPGLTVYLLDITESKKEKEQLSLLSNAVARLNDIVLITEADPIDLPGPRIVFVNDAFERKTGYSKAEAIGKTPRMLQGPGTQRPELDRIRAALEAGQPVRSQLLNYTKAGEEIWLEIEIVPVTDRNGNNTHLIAVERDITQQRKLEHQLAVAQRMESIGQLTGGLAHDFNNLLSVIMGNADLLQGELEKHEAWQLSDMVDLIIRAAERGEALTQNMLTFARRQTLRPKLINPASLLADIAPILRSSCGQRNTLTLNIEPDVWMVEIDVGQLENSLINLTLNSRDAMPRGGEIRVDVKNHVVTEEEAANMPGIKPGPFVLLQFSDTGVGMPPETLAKAFEPFFTTKDKQGGTGLGLSTVYGFIKQSDGYIQVKSEPAEGTVFGLYLRKAESATSGQNRTPDTSDDFITQLRGKTILCVEDNRDLQQVNRKILEGVDVKVRTAANAQDAMSQIRRDSNIDLVMTDVVMPGEFSGIDLAEFARSELPGVPVILTSGFSELTTLSDDERWKQFSFLKKPYRPRELLEVIHKNLGGGND
tara:strand:- start:12930 stop:15578 length:2649 start_codon:yes stop_codon:yes gene_type:complete